MEALSGSPGESYFQDAQGRGEAAAKRSWRKLLILLMAFLESWEVFPKSGRVERREMPSREGWVEQGGPEGKLAFSCQEFSHQRGAAMGGVRGESEKTGMQNTFFYFFLKTNSLEKSKSITEHQHIPHPRAPQDKPPVAQLAQLVGGGCWEGDARRSHPWQLHRAGQLPSSRICSLSVDFIDTKIYISTELLIFPIPTP